MGKDGPGGGNAEAGRPASGAAPNGYCSVGTTGEETVCRSGVNRPGKCFLSPADIGGLGIGGRL